MVLKKRLLDVIKNPDTYCSAAVGVLAGFISGGVIGLFSGLSLAYNQMIFIGLQGTMLTLNNQLIIGGLVGLVSMALVNALIFGGYFVLRANVFVLNDVVYKEDNLFQNLFKWILPAFELAAAAMIGAVLGSIRQPGLGTLLGAGLASLTVLGKMMWDDYVVWRDAVE